MKKCACTLELSCSLSLHLFCCLHIIASSDVEETEKLVWVEGDRQSSTCLRCVMGACIQHVINQPFKNYLPSKYSRCKALEKVILLEPCTKKGQSKLSVKIHILTKDTRLLWYIEENIKLSCLAFISLMYLHSGSAYSSVSHQEYSMLVNLQKRTL